MRACVRKASGPGLRLNTLRTLRNPSRPRGPLSYGESDMTLASLRERLSAPLEWNAARVAAHPKGALAIWIVSLAIVAWVF